MKKSSITLLVVLFIVQHIAAQNSSNTYKRFGFKAGVNVSNMNFNKGVPPPASHITPTWKTGITFGFLLQVPVTSDLWVQPEYSFSQVSGEDKSTGIKYQLNYLSLPVLLKYQLSKTFSIEVGPQFDLLINAKKQVGETSSNITHDTEERNFGIDAGVEFQLFKSLCLDARYMNGINHIGIGQRSDVKECKLQQFQLTASVRF